MALLEIKNLTFCYPKGGQALKDINLSIEQSEFILICGASGCGKSTLLRHIKPVLRPHGEMTGEILLDGSPIDEMDFRAQSEQIGFVMQDPEMQIVTDKVWHELAFGLESLGVDNRSMRLRIAEMASFFGIQGLFDRPVSMLSGGEKQLVCLTSVMAMQPKLVLLDEPTSQLDPIAAGEFFNTLKRINSELGTTIIITEHRFESLFPLVDRVAFMRNGEIVECCNPADAAQKLRNDAELFSVLPTAMRIYAETCLGGHDLNGAPLTVREGREYLSTLKLDLNSQNNDSFQIHNSKRLSKPLIRVHEAWFRYDRDSEDVLRGLSFEIRAGELTCVIGGNGAGKTTALLVAAGIYRPYRGKVQHIRNDDAAKMPNNGVAMLMQNPRSSFVKDSVREELESACRAHRIPASRMSEVVSLMEIEPILDSHPYDISGGELQRAAIARILLPSPNIVFLDEATKGMDAFFKAKFGALLRRLTEGGTAVVLVSHDIEFCAEFSDRCVMLFNGEITAEGSPREVFLGNSFYTTAANRIARGIIDSAVLAEDIISAVKN